MLYRLFHHKEPVKSLEQAASERGQIFGQVVRSILFRTGESNFVMALIAGPAQISLPKLLAFLRQSQLTLTTEDEVLVITATERVQSHCLGFLAHGVFRQMKTYSSLLKFSLVLVDAEKLSS